MGVVGLLGCWGVGSSSEQLFGVAILVNLACIRLHSLPKNVTSTIMTANQNTAMQQFMHAAIDEARQGLAEGGIPIGSVLVHAGKIIGRGHNRRVQQGSTVLHGEMDALENAGRLSAAVYRDSQLFTTLSPCAMCSGAILLYGIPQVIVGENQTFLGEEELLRERGVKVEVLQSPDCIKLMNEFIAAQPDLWNEDIGV